MNSWQYRKVCLTSQKCAQNICVPFLQLRGFCTTLPAGQMERIGMAPEDGFWQDFFVGLAKDLVISYLTAVPFEKYVVNCILRMLQVLGYF